MTDNNTIDNVLEHASISDADRKQLRRIIDNGLTGSEQRELARQLEDDPELLHQLNEIIKKKQEYLNNPDKFDEILEQEEALLERLQT